MKQAATALAEQGSGSVRAVTAACASDSRLSRLISELCAVETQLAEIDPKGEAGAARLPVLAARRSRLQDDIATVTFLVTRAWESASTR